jgi:hypothetical protein
LPELAYLKGKSPEDLVGLRHGARLELKRYEDALRIARTVLGERQG